MDSGESIVRRSLSHSPSPNISTFRALRTFANNQTRAGRTAGNWRGLRGLQRLSAGVHAEYVRPASSPVPDRALQMEPPALSATEISDLQISARHIQDCVQGYGIATCQIQAALCDCCAGGQFACALGIDWSCAGVGKCLVTSWNNT
jgi:hypothetical protein